MPTQTNPNRAFSLCGTSLGRLVNAGPDSIGIEQFETPTIWNALAKANTTMGLYYHEIWHDGECFTEYTFPYIKQLFLSADHPLLQIATIDDPSNGFFARARTGTLPAFSYIEPKWGGGISYHLSNAGQ